MWLYLGLSLDLEVNLYLLFVHEVYFVCVHSLMSVYMSQCY